MDLEEFTEEEIEDEEDLRVEEAHRWLAEVWDDLALQAYQIVSLHPVLDQEDEELWPEEQRKQYKEEYLELFKQAIIREYMGRLSDRCRAPKEVEEEHLRITLNRIFALVRYAYEAGVYRRIIPDPQTEWIQSYARATAYHF